LKGWNITSGLGKSPDYSRLYGKFMVNKQWTVAGGSQYMEK
jgi:hypothetical protein